ncbi:hypothetical protein RE474_11495 [Methanolobus sediminis]|uniref:Uncharacterized protein n=1 Tax=Methanolobus sediminis TaxID=3072978 RepID=A0AA51UJI3_9EURY|nr:hypothetical protein [Methanolobus sediminis]WMW24697.1 hypothetical protein RE474_11495 [Methanolobus sediminis]
MGRQARYDNKKQMCISFTPTTYDRIDEERGVIPRSAFVSNIVEQYFAGKQVDN